MLPRIDHSPKKSGMKKKTELFNAWGTNRSSHDRVGVEDHPGLFLTADSLDSHIFCCRKCRESKNLQMRTKSIYIEISYAYLFKEQSFEPNLINVSVGFDIVNIAEL